MATSALAFHQFGAIVSGQRWKNLRSIQEEFLSSGFYVSETKLNLIFLDFISLIRHAAVDDIGASRSAKKIKSSSSSASNIPKSHS